MGQPKLLQKPWGVNGLRNDVPTVRSNNLAQEASTYEEGFPSITMTPISVGGKPPSGKDMNGVLYDITDNISYLNRGGRFTFIRDFCTAIGGYPKGAVLSNNAGTAEYISLVDKNTDDFNTVASTKWALLSSTGKPRKITSDSKDEIDTLGHSHSIDKASTSVAGIVMLVNALNSTATDRALTAAQGKVLADFIAALGDEAFKQRGALGSRNLDTLKGITNFGVWFMSANAGATTALNYPADRAGTLLVLPAAYEGIQLYIPYDWAEIYIRNTQSEAWSDWRIIGEVANSLTSTSATAALSAAQGKNLQDNKADKATTLAGYGLGNAIAMLTGTIADGGTIPLPAGFTQGQCKWFVSMASDNPSLKAWDIDENRSRVNYRFECTASAARVVNARMYWEGQGGSSGSVPSTANYLVIAYK